MSELVAHGGHDEVDHEVGCTGIHHRKLLMWAFLGSDCMFFGSLIMTYLVYHGRYTEGPFPFQTFNVTVTSISTFVLLCSSLLMVLALAAIQRNDIGKFRLWCAGTAFFGLIFLGFQAFEFTEFVEKHGLTLSKNLFGSTFYVLTGTHGTHVAFGVLWLLSLLVYSYTGKLNSDRALDVEIAGLYWHFVDIVWIVIFTVVYLIEILENAGVPKI
jgi:heme/copper-type cytochrome/quinol oxidase subunit 3